MKKPLLFVLVILMAVATFVPAGESAEDDEVTIALVVKNIGNPFFDAIKRGWDEAVAEIGQSSQLRKVRSRSWIS